MTLSLSGRTGLLGGVTLGLALVTALSAPADDAKNAREVRAVLARETNFDTLDDPKTTLGEFLDLVSKRYALKFKINDKAFTAEQVANPESCEIAARRPVPAMKGVQLDRVLRKVLDRVPVPSGAAFVVRDNVIEVTTEAALAAARQKPEPPPSPTANMLAREKAARATLAGPVDFPGFDDPKTTLQEALDFLAARYNLKFDVIDAAFEVEEIQDVLRAEIATKPLPAMKKQPLSKVLDAVLAGLPKEAKPTRLVRPGGVIEITTARYADYERKNGRPPRRTSFEEAK
jgi:hypothetical protein